MPALTFSNAALLGREAQLLQLRRRSPNALEANSLVVAGGVTSSQRLRKQSKCLDMAGLHGTDVSAVKRRHLGHSEPFRDCDEAGISAAEWPVVVQLDELRHALVVSSGDVDRDQAARREQPQERRFALAARSSLKQVTDLGRNGRRYKQLLSYRAQ
jgi:hypothetical protein